MFGLLEVSPFFVVSQQVCRGLGRPWAKTKNLTIYERAHVTRIISDGNGKVTGVQYQREGQQHILPVKVVLIASYTYENVRRRCSQNPSVFDRTVQPSHGQVGKNFISHWAARETLALLPFDLNIWYGAMSQGVTTDDWADDSFDHSGLGFIGGASLTVNHEVHPIAGAAMPTFGRAPARGSKWKTVVRENAGRWVGVYAQCNTFPYENTYLDLDQEVKGPFGDPVCRTTRGAKENEPKASEYVNAKAAEWFRQAGAIEVATTFARVTILWGITGIAMMFVKTST